MMGPEQLDSLDIASNAVNAMSDDSAGDNYKGERASCDLCPFSSTIAAEIEKHLISAHLQVKRFRCQQCKFKADRQYRLTMHLRVTHGSPATSLKCPSCSYEAVDKAFLNWHVNSKHLVDNVEVTDRNRHLSKTPAVPTKELINSVKCMLCNFKTFSNFRLKRHMRTIHFGRDKRCTKCPKVFPTRNQLEDHFRAIHEQVKPFECEDCGRGFARKPHLRTHIKEMHLNIKAYKCRVCEKDFKRGFHLRLHMKNLHPGAEEVADWSTTQVVDRNPYQCPICEKTVVGLQNLEVHKTSVHSGPKD